MFSACVCGHPQGWAALAQKGLRGCSNNTEDRGLSFQGKTGAKQVRKLRSVEGAIIIAQKEAHLAFEDGCASTSKEKQLLDTPWQGALPCSVLGVDCDTALTSTLIFL